jgi:hypothetical protein
MAKTTAPKNQLRLKLNLLHPNEIPPSLPTRFLRWVVSYGRYIVIFTEIIVVSAFVYRFKLDYDLDALKTSINKDVPFIEGLISDEALIVQTQTKLKTIGLSYNSSPNWHRIFQDLSTVIPKSVRVNSLNIDNSDNTTEYISIKFVGETASNNDLGLFIRKLRDLKDDQGNKMYKDIVLDTLNYNKDSLIFSISGGAKRL